MPNDSMMSFTQELLIVTLRAWRERKIMKLEKFGREVRGDDNHIISPLLLLPSLGDLPLPQTLS